MFLGIETSSLVSSVAIMKDEKLVGELTVQAGLTHSEQLVPHIDILMKSCQVDKKDLQGIGVSIGPGSFTGLRIGLGTAKAMAYALRIPIVGVLTPEVLAYNFAYTNSLICVCIDAQKKNVYEALYRCNGEAIEVLQKPVVKSFMTTLEELASQANPVIFVGDGIGKNRDEILSFAPHFSVALPTMAIPRAGQLLWAAKNRFAFNEVDDVMSIQPFYIRKSEAEVLWEKRQKELSSEN